MITAPFDYEAPESLEEAVRMLHENGEDAKLLAGGHSLLPLMKVRLAAPTILIDLRKVPGLDHVQQDDGGWRIGAMTRHAQLQDTSELGVVSRAASLIADQQVRNRGTIGGSLAHCDPASDMPAVMLALGAELDVRGKGGTRSIPVADFFTGVFETALAPDEALVEVRVLKLGASTGWAYLKANRRAQDWATVGVAALVHRDDGKVAGASIGLVNMGATPLRARAAEDALAGGSSVADAAALVGQGTEPPSDQAGSSEYRAHLAQVLTRRALEQAAEA